MTPDALAAGREVARVAGAGSGPSARWIRNAVDDTFERHGAELIEATDARARELGVTREEQIRECAILLALEVAEWLLQRAQLKK